MVKVSIIVPVYNCGKYLPETLNALINQTLHEIEIILVNDGSTDDSGDICRSYEASDNRIIYIEQANSGPSTARNLGLTIAKGEYIGFCDGDDIPNVNMYQTLYEYGINSEADLVMCDMYSERNQCEFGLPYDDGQELDREQILFDFIPKMIGAETDDAVDNAIWGSVVRCLYKKSLLDKHEIRFPNDIAFAEDLVFTIEFLSHSNSIVICNQVLYFYRLNTDSLMNSHRNYQSNMFHKRKKLNGHIEKISTKMKMEKHYTQNRLVSFRAYIHESVGNTCRSSKNRNIVDSYRELKEILHDEDVKKAFSSFRSTDKRKFMLYKAIEKKLCLALLCYYKLRFIQSE